MFQIMERNNTDTEMQLYNLLKWLNFSMVNFNSYRVINLGKTHKEFLPFGSPTLFMKI